MASKPSHLNDQGNCHMVNVGDKPITRRRAEAEAIIVVGGYFSLAAYWNHHDKTIAAELGERLVSTGYVIAVVSGMADVFGFGGGGIPQGPSPGSWAPTRPGTVSAPTQRARKREGTDIPP